MSELTRNDIGCIPADELTEFSDNIAIALCTYFEKHSCRPSDDEETENGWGRWVEEMASKALDRIAETANRRHDPAPVGVRVPDAQIEADFQKIGQYLEEAGHQHDGDAMTTLSAIWMSLNPQPGAVVGEAAMELVTAIRSGVPVGEGKVYFTARGMEHVEQCIARLLRTLTNADKGEPK